MYQEVYAEDTHGLYKFIVGGIIDRTSMSPFIVVAGFVVLLALVIYFMYKDQMRPDEEAPAEKPMEEPKVVKVRDYEAQLREEKPAEEEKPKEEESETEEPEEPETEKHEPLEPTPEASSEAEDLESLSGVGEKYRELLRVAGVSSVAGLAAEDPEALLGKLRAANEEHGIVKRLPRAGDVEGWVQRAKEQGA